MSLSRHLPDEPEVRSWLLGNRMVSIPFATLCDPLITINAHVDKLLKKTMDLSDEHRCSHIEIRTLQAAQFVENSHFSSTNFYKHHYLSLDQEPAQLMKSFHRTNVRQRIQRAIDSGVHIQTGSSESDLANFFALHVQTRKKLHLPPQPFQFFRMLWNTFHATGQMVLMLAGLEGQIIAGLILFKFKNRVSAEFLASDERFLNVSPNHLLFWEAIKSSREEGFKIFDFGRTSANNESLMTFKSRWGTKVVDLRNFYYPKDMAAHVTKREESISYKFISQICSHSSTPTLLRIGRICYRHLG